MFLCCCKSSGQNQEEAVQWPQPYAGGEDEYGEYEYEEWDEEDDWVYGNSASYWYDEQGGYYEGQEDWGEEAHHGGHEEEGAGAAGEAPEAPAPEPEHKEVIQEEITKPPPPPVAEHLPPVVEENKPETLADSFSKDDFPLPGPGTEGTEEVVMKHISAHVKKATPQAAIGWHLDMLDNRYLFICRLVNSPVTPVSMYNAGQPESQRIQAGDYIVAVNEANTSETMSEVLRNSEDLRMNIVRPLVLKRTVEKRGMSLGLDLKYGPGGTSLLIDGIRDGAVRKYNYDIRTGDRIVSAAGQTGQPNVLMLAIHQASVVELVISRPPALSP